MAIGGNHLAEEVMDLVWQRADVRVVKKTPQVVEGLARPLTKLGHDRLAISDDRILGEQRRGTQIVVIRVRRRERRARVALAHL